MRLPKLEIKKSGRITRRNGKKENFAVEKYVTLRQSNYRKKSFVLEEISFSDRNEIRIGYYIIGKKGRMKGKWVWGQFCPLLPKQDLRKLIRKARQVGII